MRKLIISLLTLMAVSILGCFNTAYAEGGSSGMQDFEAPIVRSLSISSEKSNLVVTKGDKINVTARVTDNMSGTSSVSVYFRNSNGNSISAYLYRSDGTEIDGTWKGSVTIGQYQAQGEYTLSSISVSDKAQNSTSKLPDGITKVKFTVTGTDVDNEAPVIKSISLSKTETTSPTKDGEEIEVTAVVTDNISCRYSGSVTFRNDAYPSHDVRCSLYHNSEQETNSKEFTYTGKLYLNKYTRLGEYKTYDTSFSDDAGNYARDPGEKLSFNVTEGEGFFDDNTSPSINSIELNVNKITAPGTVKVIAEADDPAGEGEDDQETGEGSGISYIYVRFYNNLYSRSFYTYLYREGVSSNKYTGNIEVDQWARPNDYVISSVTGYDRAQNSVSGIPEGSKNLTLEVFNGGGSENYEHRSNTENISEEINKVNEGEKILVHYTKENDTVPADVFDAIKGQDKTVTLEEEGVQWVFNGKDIEDDKNIKDVHLTVSVNEIDSVEVDDEKKADIKRIAGDAHIVVLSFPENGDLPGTATINIKTDHVLREYLGKDKGLFVYYYDNKRKRLVGIANNVDIQTDQYFSFPIEHCSDYILSPVELPEQLMTPENVRWTGEDKTVAAWDPAGGAYYDLELRVEHGADAEERSLKVNGNSKDLTAEIGRLFALFNVEKPDEITGVKFRVRANDGDDEKGEDSDWTEWVEDSGFRPVVLQPPVTLSWNGTEKTTASWNEVPNADSYYVLLRVDYGGAHKQTSLVTKNTSVELKSRIDKLFDTIEDESMISSVSYRVYCKPSNDGLYLKSEWSGSSPDSGYRRSDEGGESGGGETVVKPRVVAVKGKKSLAAASFKAARWESANKNIASVDPQGVVTGKKPGEVVITAYGEGANPDTRNYTVIVEKPVLKNKTVYTKDSFDLEKSITGVEKLVATGYLSANPEVLEVDDLGYVTVKKSGKTRLTVEYGSVKVSATYTVKLPNLKEASVSLLEGKGKKLTTVNKAKSLTITYKSSDEDIATVDSSGKVKAVAPGTAGISLLVDGNVYDNCRITVKAPELTNKKDPVELKKNKTYQLKVKNKTKNVSYKSSNEDVVTVTKNGKVKGKAEGEAYVYLLLNGKVYDKCLFNVK